MKKAKIAFWLILIAFLALLAYQNWDFFMSRHGLHINLFVVKYTTPKLQNAVLFLIFFFAGLLIAYFFTLFERFKSKKTIKSLNNSVELSQKMVEELQKEVSLLKGEAPKSTPPDIETDHQEAKDSNVS